ncbi:MAG: FtsQ-type POTRA domain-containing protein [Nitrospirae bacterium]|nr:FtsQ-type POTRA domain-containing protein [Nitrospirota bacterium]
MRLRKQKSKKNQASERPASGRFGRALFFLKRGAVAVLVISFFVLVAFGVTGADRAFKVKTIIIEGNKNLTENEIMDKITSGSRKGLLFTSFSGMEKKLKTSPWIKGAELRKEFPDTIFVKVKEAVPRAILSIKEGMFLVDGEGSMLEELSEEKPPFLPLITGIDPEKNNKNMIEALKLVEALSREGILLNREFVEITLEAYGLSANMDGEIFKVGYGKYAEKFRKWSELEPEIRKKGVAIEYVDLRFTGEIIVRPVKVDKQELKPQKGRG